MRIFGRIAFVLMVLVTISFSKDKKRSPEVTVGELKMHISYLASDKLKGRLTGSEGDSLAAEYIRRDLKASGFDHLYKKGFQRFRVTDKIIYGPDNFLTLNGNSLKINTDFKGKI